MSRLDGRTTRHIPDWIVIDEPTRTCECQRCGTSDQLLLAFPEVRAAAWRVLCRTFLRVHKRCLEVDPNAN